MPPLHRAHEALSFGIAGEFALAASGGSLLELMPAVIEIDMSRALSLGLFLFGSVCALAQSVIETDIYDAGPSLVGNHPGTSLIQASDGNLYGTMQNVDYEGRYGSVYRISPTGEVSVLHAFTNGVDGGQPQASLIEGPDGALYGTTSQGGSGYEGGTVFRLTLDGQLTTLFAFTGEANATAMNTTLTFGSDGNLYGVSSVGGPQYTGALFKMSTQGKFTDLFNFVASDFYEYPAGETPESPLLEYTPGTFIGTTQQGGEGNAYGTVFVISSTGDFQQLYNFGGNGIGGVENFLAIGSDGAAYGTAADGPGSGGGVFYRISPEGAYSTIHSMDESREGNGLDGLFLGSDGRFYSSTFGGGSNGTGTIVATTSSGDLTVLHNFSAVTDTGSDDGWNATSPPVQASDGAFYGTTTSGGAYLDGMIYRLAFSPALPAPVQLSFSSQGTTAGQPVKLSWKVINGFSTTMQQCFAFVQNNFSGAGNWTGLQRGTVSNGAYQGSSILVPTATGNFTYALTCGGVESGFATLKVSGSTKKSTSSSFQIGPNPIPHKANVGFSVTVSGSSGTPTGNVSFLSAGKTLAIFPLTNGSLSTSFSTNTFPTGDYEVTASYLGDANFAPSTSAPVAATILPALSATTIALYDVNAFAAPLNGQVNADVQVFSTLEDSLPNGEVNYYINDTLVGTASIGDQGFVEGRINLEGFAAGTYLLNATYLGDAEDSPASAIPVVLYIGVSPNEIFLDVNPITVTAPAEETLTAHVYNDNDDTFPTSGSVVFSVGGQVFGSAPVNSKGYATLVFSTSGVPTGAYPVVATFQGNNKFGISSSPAQTVTVK